MLKSIFNQKFLWAVLLFVVLSQSLSRLHIASAPPEFLEQTWTSWAVDQFTKTLDHTPQVVLLGSSLVLTPINLCDAQILGKTLDGSQHHESYYLARLIHQLTGQKIQTFNFALPGEMPSDAYLITKLFLTGNKKPELLVYGVGPRDFMDNLLASPSATDPYHYFRRLFPESTDCSFAGNSFEDRMDVLLSRLIYAYQRKENIKNQFEALIKTFHGSEFAPSNGTPVWTNSKLRLIAPSYHPMSIAKGECLFRPVAEQKENGFKDNLEEYRRRYGHLNWNKFLTQLKFLAKTLGLARQQHTKAVVVVMPITTINRKLIPTMDWNAYKWSLRVIAVSKGARFMDLEDSKQFNDNDFGDTVHLNTIGGIKLVQLIATDLLAHDEFKFGTMPAVQATYVDAKKGAEL